jgi:hypothetical protein
LLATCWFWWVASTRFYSVSANTSLSKVLKMSGKKSKSGGLGRALMKNPAAPTKRKGYVDEWGTTQYPDEPKPLESIIDASDIQGIMENVSLQNQRFLTERQNVVVLSTTAFVLSDKLSPEQIEAKKTHWNDLTIPRRFVSHLCFISQPFWVGRSSFVAKSPFRMFGPSVSNIVFHCMMLCYCIGNVMATVRNDAAIIRFSFAFFRFRFAWFSRFTFLTLCLFLCAPDLSGPLK